jgi:hypothetical protein
MQKKENLGKSNKDNNSIKPVKNLRNSKSKYKSS